MKRIRNTRTSTTRWLLAGATGLSLAIAGGCSTSDKEMREAPTYTEPMVDDSPLTEADNLPDDAEERMAQPDVGERIAGTQGGLAAEPMATRDELAMVLEQPEGYVGREVGGVVKVEEVVGDRGFWITKEGSGARLFVVLDEGVGEQELDVEAGQLIRLRGTVHEGGGQARVGAALEAPAEQIIGQQPFFLTARSGAVAVLEGADTGGMQRTPMVGEAGETDSAERQRTAQRNQRFEQWDRDRDQRLSREELDAGVGSAGAGVYQSFDTNGDGVLEQDEIASGFSNRWDTNNDGFIDRDEYAAGSGSAADELDEEFGTLDADDDDVIGSDEFEQNVARWPYYERIDISEDRRIDRREMDVTMFDDLDADDDDFLDEDEFRNFDDDIFDSGFDDEPGVGEDFGDDFDDELGVEELDDRTLDDSGIDVFD